VAKEHRFDVGGLRFQPTIDPFSGYLRADARLTRVGVFAYTLPDGTVRREFRSPGEVFRPESMSSLRMAPVTNDHPSVPVSSLNAKDFGRGAIGDRVDQDNVYLSSSLAIWDRDLIALAQSGKQELSCGYTCDVVMEPGMWNGISYDARQENIMYNHVAVVDQGRAGPSVRIKMDRMDSGEPILWGELTPEENETMDKDLVIALLSMVGLSAEADRSDSNKLTVAGKKYDVSTKEGLAAFKSAMDELFKEKKAELKAAGKQPKGDSDSVTAESLARLEAKVDALSEERDSLRGKVAELEKQTQDGAIESRVKARVELITVAQKFAPSVKVDGLDDDGIRRAVLLAVAPEAAREDLSKKFDSKGEIYVSARWDQLIEDGVQSKDPKALQSKGDGVRALADVSLKVRGTEDKKENRADADEARAAMINRFGKKAAGK
jgi:hypothetical protein